MTPMIDMTFQLIAFFMVLLNFADTEQNERIRLPSSELAKPPETAFESPVVLQLTKNDTVLFGGDEIPISGLSRPLSLERQVIEAKKRNPADATVIIRADADAKTGTVQTVIQKCQENKFEKFALRVKQESKGH